MSDTNAFDNPLFKRSFVPGFLKSTKTLFITIPYSAVSNWSYDTVSGSENPFWNKIRKITGGIGVGSDNDCSLEIGLRGRWPVVGVEPEWDPDVVSTLSKLFVVGCGEGETEWEVSMLSKSQWGCLKLKVTD